MCWRRCERCSRATDTGRSWGGRRGGESGQHDKIKLQFDRQGRELEEARAIQEGFLPKSIPQMAGYEISGTWQPARIVGGDYFDVMAFGGGGMGVCIGDVARKGSLA